MPRAGPQATRSPASHMCANPLLIQANRYNKLALLHIYSETAGSTVAGRVQMTNGKRGWNAHDARCPRCNRTRCLSPADDHYGPDLYCLLCGWHGLADESGQPVELDHAAPFIGRKRRRRRKPAAASTPEARAS